VNFWDPADPDEGERTRGEMLRHHGARALLALGLAAFTYVLFPAAPAAESTVLEVGSVAPDNVIAPFDFTVPKSADELEREQEDIARSVAPVFQATPAAADSSRRALLAFGEALRRAQAVGRSQAARAEAVQASAREHGLALTAGEAAYLAQPERAQAMLDAVLTVYGRWHAQGVASSGSFDGVRGTVSVQRDGTERVLDADSVPTLATLLSLAQRVQPDPSTAVARDVFRKLVAGFFRPTLVFDDVATERARQELRRTIPTTKYELQAGQKIVGAHEVVGREQREIMVALREQVAARTQGARNARRATGTILFNALFLTLFGLTLVLFRPQLYASMRSLLLIATLFALVIGGAAIVAHVPALFHPELIPVAFAAVVLSLLFDPRISLVGAMFLSALIGGQSEFGGTSAIFLGLVGGTAAAFAVRVVRRRNQTHWLMLLIAGAYLVAVLTIGLALDRSFADIGRSALWAAANALISVALAMVVLPPAEQFAGVDTYFTLLEWSDLNRPLLRRLSLEAPGTYAHTIAISNLAESACNAIGANGLLARVGAYYHDIGKLKKPQYFVENQAKGRNPHDKLKPGMSAAIIRNHVREGIELAEEHHVPRAVRAFITEHHGTNPISYFIEKAKEKDGAVPANAAEFAYPGPVPQTAETAVVMLADGVEAAVRVLSDPSPSRIREVVDRIVRQRMDQGQLVDAPLTLRQLETVKEQFVRVLAGMHHTRIDYPAASGGITSEFAAV
jgi:putative nucleotidyltransferase with HDIG domain